MSERPVPATRAVVADPSGEPTTLALYKEDGGLASIVLGPAAPMVVETRAPCAVNEPKTAHYIHGKDNGPCRFLLLQGVGVYDMPVGG